MQPLSETRKIEGILTAVNLKGLVLLIAGHFVIDINTEALPAFLPFIPLLGLITFLFIPCPAHQKETVA